MFSPTDPDLILVAQDSWADPITGEARAAVDRLWTIRRGEKARAILPTTRCLPPIAATNGGTPTASTSGFSITPKVRAGDQEGQPQNRKSRDHLAEWTRSFPLRPHRKILAGDIVSWPVDAWRVAFFNVATGKEVSIVTQLPRALSRKISRSPHPQFCQNDRYVCYTTNVFDKVEVALVPVEQLVGRTQ